MGQESAALRPRGSLSTVWLPARRRRCPPHGESTAIPSDACSLWQTELVSGDQAGNVRVWDLQANACVQELGPKDYDYPADTE